jgi:hypothetical protein
MKIEEFFASVAGGCQAPECTHPHDAVVLNARCHPGSGTDIEVDSKKRTVRMRCHVCHVVIARIEFPFIN